MKNRIHHGLERLLSDLRPETKISLYFPVKGDYPVHVLFAGLRDSAIRLIPDKAFSIEFRHWIQTIRTDLEINQDIRTVACFFSCSTREVIYLEREIPPRVVVSQSWHVKPLLYVANARSWGYIFEFNQDGISLIRSDGDSHELVETLVPPVKTPLPTKYWHEDLTREDLRAFISLAVGKIPKGSMVQISGAPDGFARSPKYWQHFWSSIHIDNNYNGERTRSENLLTFSRILQLHKQDLELVDVLKEIGSTPAFSEPSLILKKIKEGKILRLFISLEAIQWGVLDHASGQIKKSKFQMNHIDEDILDDIAEFALHSGVEVRILRQSAFPPNIEIIAA